MAWCQLPRPRTAFPTSASCRIVIAAGSLHRPHIVVIVVIGATTVQVMMFPLSLLWTLHRRSSLQCSALALSVGFDPLNNAFRYQILINVVDQSSRA
jgi:hypothetical protein